MDFAADPRALLRGYLAAYGRQDAAGSAAFCHPEGRIDSPFGPPAVGRAAIATTHVGWFDMPETDKRLEVLAAEACGGIGYALLRYSADTPEGPEAGTSLNVLERDAGGAWRFRLTSLNADFKN